ncbi:hypothetical protein J6590_084033 [Homalodisca vitripennis]|nr:hypothetical protein J6590_084033 [Homalodisca vitripennis]
MSASVANEHRNHVTLAQLVVTESWYNDDDCNYVLLEDFPFSLKLSVYSVCPDKEIRKGEVKIIFFSNHEGRTQEHIPCELAPENFHLSICLYGIQRMKKPMDLIYRMKRHFYKANI